MIFIPKIIFELSQIEGLDTEKLIKSGSGNLKIMVEGTLQVHGVTKEIRFPVRGSYEGGKLVVEGTVEIRYSDFNMDPPTLGWILKQASDELKLALVSLLIWLNRHPPPLSIKNRVRDF